MAGAKADVMATACTLAVRLAAFCARKRFTLSAVRPKACASRMPVISRSRPAVTSPTVSRVVRKARRARRAKNAVVASITGMTRKLASASMGSSSSIAIRMPIRLNSAPTSCVTPPLSSWFSVSTSFMTRLSRSPTGCREK